MINKHIKAVSAADVTGACIAGRDGNSGLRSAGRQGGARLRPRPFNHLNRLCKPNKAVHFSTFLLLQATRAEGKRGEGGEGRGEAGGEGKKVKREKQVKRGRR